jgi:hypothetical protein
MSSLSKETLTDRNLSAPLCEIMDGLGIIENMNIYIRLRYYNSLYNLKPLRDREIKNLTQSNIRTQSEARKLSLEKLSSHR